jgi:homospermidine synthase
VITHNESISISDYFTIRGNDGEEIVYRPTVHYAYHPCDGAVLSLHEVAGDNGELQKKHRLIVDEIVDGLDELGVLIMGHDKNAYWYGSRLSIEDARKLIHHNSATSLQVTAAVLGGVIWALENPRRGVVDADEMDYERILEIARPYLGEIVGEYTDWTPLHKRKLDDAPLFPQDIDESDPWQFKNFQVS